MIAPQPFFQPRGTPFSVLHRLRALSRLGHKIDLVTYHLGQNVAIENVQIRRAAGVKFIKEIAIGPSLHKLLLDVFVYRRALALLRQNRYELLHTHEEAGFMGIRLSRQFGLPHLYDMHSSLPQQLSNFKYSQNPLLVRLFERLEAATINSAQAVITICPELHHYVRERFPDKFNKLIENVADNSDVFGTSVDLQELKQRYRLNGETVVLYTGTLEPYQGLDLLLACSARVVKEQPQTRFLVVGGKPEQVRDNQEKAKQLGVADKFIFTGQRPPEEIPQFMRLAQVLVSPRLEGNNTPLKIYSYLRSGVPIVATNHLTHTQVLNAEVAVLTDCKPEAFASGLLRVLRDRQLGEALGRKARALAEQEYSYAAYLRKTAEVYDYLQSLPRGQSS
ncbi:MAG: glycosyltransferase family 4 protein [candidate division KSB1 bacterium]|nr:glycosyltransferase family 4 protein [candidate division KSB1 bacterium]